MTIEEYFGEWSRVADLKEAYSIMKRLADSKVKVCPTLADIFKAIRLCPISRLRVVILGYDPYNNMVEGRPVATGLAFANPPGTLEENYSPSLSILRESVIDYTIPHRRIIFDPSLEKWEEQGVLMLNSALSCELGRVGSHMLMWRPFMKSLLTNLSCYHTGLVYLLMGTQAQTLEPYINKQFNHVVKIRHPSWYARQKQRMPSDIWQEINSILIGQNGYGIEWFTEY